MMNELQVFLSESFLIIICLAGLYIAYKAFMEESQYKNLDIKEAEYLTKTGDYDSDTVQPIKQGKICYALKGRNERPKR